jgi:hypothetical protein
VNVKVRDKEWEGVRDADDDVPHSIIPQRDCLLSLSHSTVHISL